MTDSKRVILAFLAKTSDDLRDVDGTPYKQEKLEISKDKAFGFMKKLYPGIKISTESMDGGLAYFGKFSVGTKMIGNYSFARRELWFKIYPGTKVPFHKP